MRSHGLHLKTYIEQDGAMMHRQIFTHVFEKNSFRISAGLLAILRGF